MARSDQSAADLIGQLTVMRGVWTILFGVIVLVWPKLTVATFLILLALWLLVSGVVAIVNSLMNRNGNWILHMLLGLLEVGVGAYLVQRPGVTLLTVVTLVGLVLVVEGVVGVVQSLMKGDGFGAKLLGVVVGLLSLVAGVLVWRYPLHGTLAFIWLLGLYCLVAGSVMLADGFALRRAD